MTAPEIIAELTRALTEIAALDAEDAPRGEVLARVSYTLGQARGIAECALKRVSE